MNEESRSFTPDELCRLVEVPRRTLRYYVQIGLLARPRGAGRGARYTSEHLERLLEIRKWQRAGLSLERIRELLSAEGAEEGLRPPPRPRSPGSVEVWSHVVLGEGVELHVEAQRAELTPEQVRALASGVAALYRRIRSGEEE